MQGKNRQHSKFRELRSEPLNKGVHAEEKEMT
jgi:hypothetical protein